ncbi:MAG: putative Ig domain-containing protein [Sedimentisphaerales bacterium]|nr:putative Ig domain-containing protein [Sedimentisphaerales bacterium]
MKRVVCLSAVVLVCLAHSAWAATAPALEPVDPQYMQYGELFTYDVEASGDPAPTFTLTSAPDGMTIDSASGVITWTPDVSQVGSSSVTVRASNSAGNANVSFDVTVLTVTPIPPALDPIPDQTIQAETMTWTYTLHASGSPTPQYRKGNAPTDMLVNRHTGEITWKPDKYDAGTHTVSVFANNDLGNSWQSFTITVLPVLYSIDISSTDGGSVTRPGEGLFDYPFRQQVAIEATAAPGYCFIYWSGTRVWEKTSPITVVPVDEDCSLRANFLPDTGPLCSLELQASNGGSVSTPGYGTYYIPQGNTVSISAVPNASCHFVNWTGSGVDAGKVSDPESADTTILMDTSYSLRANFELGTLIMYALGVSSTAGGHVEKPGQGSFRYADGSTASVSAVADQGYYFLGWTGSAVDAGKVASPTSASTTVQIDADYYLRANFQSGQRSRLTLSAGTGGHVTAPGEGAFEYTPGTVVSVTAQALNGYEFSGWTGSAVDAGKVDDPHSTSTSVTVDGEYTLAASFEATEPTVHYTLDVSVTYSGTVTTPGIGLFTYDSVTTVPVVAEARSGYEFREWRGTAVDAGKVADPESSSTTVLVDGDYTLVAYIVYAGPPEQCTLTVSAEDGGHVVEPGEGTFTIPKDRWPRLVAEPFSGYRFSHWTGTAVDAGRVESPTSASTKMTLDADYTVVAHFIAGGHTLTISSGNGGSVTSPGEGTYSYESATSVSVTATAQANHHFTGWSGTAVTAGKVADAGAASTTVTMDADYTLIAGFAIDQHTLTISSGSGGSVDLPGEGAFSCDHGSTVAVQAVAESGGSFAGWTGTAVDAGKVANPSAAVTSVTVDADYTLVANFGLPQHTLTVSSGTGGYVVDPDEGSHSYQVGTEVRLEAQAMAGYYFSHWSGGSFWSDVNPMTLTIDRDYDITAIFTAYPCDLTVSSGAGGSVAVPGEGLFTYAGGTRVCAVAVPDSGYCFAGWSGSLVAGGDIGTPSAGRVDFVLAADGDLHATFAPASMCWYVDDDAPGDVAPCDPTVSDPREDGSWDHPFDSLQEAIDASFDGQAVLVRPGVYYENIAFSARSITLSSLATAEPGAISQTTIHGGDLASVVTFDGRESARSVLAGFTITGGNADTGGGVRCIGASPVIANCLIVGNRTDLGGGVLLQDSRATLVNCTIADNFSRLEGGGLYCTGSATITNSILWANLPQQIVVDPPGTLSVTYSNVQRDWPGTGNFDAAPRFAAPGHWVLIDDLASPAEPSDVTATWFHGDYHLCSTQGRWDPIQTLWVQDVVASPCIDAGNPDTDVRAEVSPHGGRINAGAFGGTAEASLSPVEDAEQ